MDFTLNEPDTESSEKPIENWTSKDFVEYWNGLYIKNLHLFPPKTTTKILSMVKNSMEHWGKPLFKEMVDFVFRSYKRHPEWQDLQINLICGSHFYATDIAYKAQVSMKKKGVFTDLIERDWFA